MDFASHTYSLEKQAAVFEDFWHRFNTQVRNGEGKIDFPPPSELTARHHTTVVRVPSDLAQRCAALIQPLKEAFPDHYYYPAQELHFTLINLDAFVGASRASAVDFVAIAEGLKQSVALLPPLTLQLKGLGIFPTTIFAQVYDTSGTIELYRTAIKKTLQALLSLDVDAEHLVKGMAFVNIARFKHAAGPEIVDALEKYRQADIGSFTAEAIELVTTDKLFSRSNTVVHDTIRLRNTDETRG
jgi:2'-5' RNA ligase